MKNEPKRVSVADLINEDDEDFGFLAFQPKSLRDFNKGLPAPKDQSTPERMQSISLELKELVRQNVELVLENINLRKENAALRILLKEKK